MPPIKLSILICTLPDREEMFYELLLKLQKQGHNKPIEIITDRSGDTTGSKRNRLLSSAEGQYSVFIDDDDEISDRYIDEILHACETNADAIAIQGYMTTNGANRIPWRISKDYPYKSVIENGQEVYLRFNNHISPIKTEIAQQFKFPDITNGEDYAWALAINQSGLIKTEAKTNGEIYHYKFITNK